jgi:hypothetical protein
MQLDGRKRCSRRLSWLTIVGVAACSAASGATPNVAVARAAATAPNSADGLIIWTNCDHVVDLSDASLDLWKSRGVDGIVCMHGHLRLMGGKQDFTGDPQASLAESNYEFQRRLRDTNIVGRMRARGLKAYLGVKLVNYRNRITPLREWFDDSGWSDLVLPKMADAAAAAKLLGFAGLAFDQELYPQRNRGAATWNWNYTGNTHSEPAVRAKARQRGRELMGALTRSFPGLELLACHVHMPETWRELVEAKVNGKPNALAAQLDIDFWDGLSSVEGYSAIRLLDEIVRKAPQLGTWDIALQYDYNKRYSYFSRKLSNWDYAASRLFVSPFSWISAGPRDSESDDARPPAYVATQLAAFRKWGMGREFANYAYGGLDAFNYGPYVSAMQAASTPGVVDAAPPALVVNPARAGSADPIASLSLEGTAADNLAIRFVRWQNDRGGSGTAEMTWDVLSGSEVTGYAWRTRWSMPTIPLQVGDNRITITVEDIKGLATTQHLAFANGRRPAGRAAPAPESAPEARPRPLKVGKVSYRARYKLARARRGLRIKVALVGTDLTARVNKGGSVKIRRRGGWYVLRLKLPRRGSYKLTLIPEGGPSQSKTIVIRVV